jgi:hypothetical protein
VVIATIRRTWDEVVGSGDSCGWPSAKVAVLQTVKVTAVRCPSKEIGGKSWTTAFASMNQNG